MSEKPTKTPETIERQNRELRNVLRRLLSLDAGQTNESEIKALQEEARSTLDKMDGRRSGGGFTKPEVQEKINERARVQSRAFLNMVGPILQELRDKGLSMQEIAETLNERGITAPAGGLWAKGSVKAQLDALARQNAEGS